MSQHARLSKIKEKAGYAYDLPTVGTQEDHKKRSCAICYGTGTFTG